MIIYIAFYVVTPLQLAYMVIDLRHIHALSPVRAGAFPQAYVTWVMCTRAIRPDQGPVPPLPTAMAENRLLPSIQELLPGELPSFPPPKPDTRTACSDAPHSPQATSRPTSASLARAASVLWRPMVLSSANAYAEPGSTSYGSGRGAASSSSQQAPAARPARWHIPHVPGRCAKRLRLLPLLALVLTR
jgi:hypothetical protein